MDKSKKCEYCSDEGFVKRSLCSGVHWSGSVEKYYKTIWLCTSNECKKKYKADNNESWIIKTKDFHF